jgi:hypothetical protein
MNPQAFQILEFDSLRELVRRGALMNWRRPLIYAGCNGR